LRDKVRGVTEKKSGFARFRKSFTRLNRYTPKQLLNYTLNRMEARLGRTRLFSYPTFVDIVPTKLCNLDCIFCIEYYTSGPKYLSLKKFNEIITKLHGFPARIAFASGGEPFLNKNMVEFLALCKRRHYDNYMVTNGMLLNREIVQAIVRDSHISELRFSFDGAEKETLERIRRGANYERIVDHIRMLAEEKKRWKSELPHMHIQFTALRSNIEELPTLIKRAREWGIERIIVNYVNIAEQVDANESLFYHPALANKIFDESLKVAHSVGLRIDLPQRLGPEGDAALNHKCYLPWTYIKIDPDGSVRFCYKAWNNPVGNIFEVKNFRALWNNEHYRLIRKTVNSNKPYFKYCGDCTVKKGKNDPAAHFYVGDYSFDAAMATRHGLHAPEPMRPGDRSFRGIRVDR